MVLDIPFSVNKKKPIKIVPTAPLLRLWDNGIKRHQEVAEIGIDRNCGRLQYFALLDLSANG